MLQGQRDDKLNEILEGQLAEKQAELDGLNESFDEANQLWEKFQAREERLRDKKQSIDGNDQATPEEK